MNAKLLDEFLSEEGDDLATGRLLAAIHEQRTRAAPTVQKYTFNRFNVTLDFETKKVSLEDDLTVDLSGELSPRCEQGWVREFRHRHSGQVVYVCEECEAL